MKMTDILLWAAGSRRPLPVFKGLRDERLLDLLGIDPDEVIGHIVAHRLTQRFLWRNAVEKPEWASRYLLERITQIQIEIQWRIKQQFQIAHQLNALCPPTIAPIFLKGFTLYALTSDRATLRYSNDMDVCPSNPEQFWSAMQSSGFSGKRHYTYEYAKASKQGVVIDLHEEFPILSYPKASRGEALSLCSPLIYHHPSYHDLKKTTLSYQDLVALSVRGRSPEATELRVLESSMAALLLCAHIFRNFVTRPYYLLEEYAVNLCELCEIARLSLLPDFRPSVFSDLIISHEASDSVAFSLFLLDSYGISHKIPRNIEEGYTAFNEFTERMFWGGWINFGDSLSWILPRPMGEFFSSLFYLNNNKREIIFGSKNSYATGIQHWQNKDILHIELCPSSEILCETLIHFGGDFYIELKIDGPSFKFNSKNHWHTDSQYLEFNLNDKKTLLSFKLNQIHKKIRDIGFVLIANRQEKSVVYECIQLES